MKAQEIRGSADVNLTHRQAEPLDMVLHCPACHLQHIDRADEQSQMQMVDGHGLPFNGWSNPPHKSHLCIPKDGGCGHIWRPADIATNGVKAIKSTGKFDSAIK